MHVIIRYPFRKLSIISKTDYSLLSEFIFISVLLSNSKIHPRSTSGPQECINQLICTTEALSELNEKSANLEFEIQRKLSYIKLLDNLLIF